MTDRKTRDAEIVRQFVAGRPRTAIGAQFGVTPRRVSQIAAEHQARRIGTVIAEKRPGAPRLAIYGDDLALYIKARRHYNAAYARELLGMAS